MKVDLNRVKKDMELISKENTTPGAGITRFSYSVEELNVKNYLIGEMKKIGMEISVDPLGNVRGRLKGRKDEHIVSGSHVDSVKNGGEFDGLLGVLSSLEVARNLVANKVELEYNYDVIIFSEEEGSNFKAGLLGSEEIAHGISKERYDELKDENGETLGEKLERSKKLLNYPHTDTLYENKKIKGMIELHIEQGNSLENQGMDIGIVNGIFHLRWKEIKVKGTGNHAGATPMAFRRDPMVEAAKIISEIPDLLKAVGDEVTVATVGKVDVFPGSPNVIPSEITFTIDLRGSSPESLDKFEEKLEERLAKSKADSFDFELNELTRIIGKECDKTLVNTMREVSKEGGYKGVDIFSGANHDSTNMSNLGPIALIFVPSVDGRSHCKEEFTSWHHVETGVKFLYDTIFSLVTK